MKKTWYILAPDTAAYNFRLYSASVFSHLFLCQVLLLCIPCLDLHQVLCLYTPTCACTKYPACVL